MIVKRRHNYAYNSMESDLLATNGRQQEEILFCSQN